MEFDDSYATDNEATEGGEQELDFWSDEGARRFNEALDEGSAYAATCGHLAEDFEEAYLEEEQSNTSTRNYATSMRRLYRPARWNSSLKTPSSCRTAFDLATGSGTD